MLKIDHAVVQLGDHHFNFSLNAPASSVHAIVGRSGAGKSTLLNLIAGFQTPSSGDIRWQGVSLLTTPPEARPITTLFQQNNLFTHLSVKDNIGLGLDSGLKLSSDDHQKIRIVLEKMELSKLADKYPPLLSGGEQQRVALARCILRQQPILLLDEPFSALDATTRQAMQSLTRQVIKSSALCVLIVTHNIDDAAALDATILHLQDGSLV